MDRRLVDDEIMECCVMIDDDDVVDSGMVREPGHGRVVVVEDHNGLGGDGGNRIRCAMNGRRVTSTSCPSCQRQADQGGEITAPNRTIAKPRSSPTQPSASNRKGVARVGVHSSVISTECQQLWLVLLDTQNKIRRRCRCLSGFLVRNSGLVVSIERRRNGRREDQKVSFVRHQ